jgi:hypothetical protein
MRSTVKPILALLLTLWAAGVLEPAADAAAQGGGGKGHKHRSEPAERAEPAEERGDDAARESGQGGEEPKGEPKTEDEAVRRLGVDPVHGPERLVLGTRRLIRIRAQMGVGGRGDVGRYRDAVEAYARFLKRDNLALVRDAIQRAELAYERLDRAWIDEVAARLRTDASVTELIAGDLAKLAESVAIAKEITRNLEEVQRLVGEGEQREGDLDRSYRNLVRLGEEARRVHGEIERLSPPPGVLLLQEQIRATYDSEVRPLREREEGLRALRTRFAGRGDRPDHRVLLLEMRAAVRKVFAIQRAVQEERDQAGG